MTNHTDLEISKALALAIGWELVEITTGHLCEGVQTWVRQRHYDSAWRVFDYRDWNVIGPIAAQYDCFPFRFGDFWELWDEDGFKADADTPQKAIALAVIGTRK